MLQTPKGHNNGGLLNFLTPFLVGGNAYDCHILKDYNFMIYFLPYEKPKKSKACFVIRNLLRFPFLSSTSSPSSTNTRVTPSFLDKLLLTRGVFLTVKSLISVAK
jgi:hypothetical protein